MRREPSYEISGLNREVDVTLKIKKPTIVGFLSVKRLLELHIIQNRLFDGIQIGFNRNWMGCCALFNRAVGIFQAITG
jgi:hypothetical protein